MRGTNRPLRRIGSFFNSLAGLLTATAALIGAILAILTAVGVIGGGGQSHGASGAHSSTAASTVSSSASGGQSLLRWAAQANAICARANDATAALPNPTTLSPKDIAGYLRTALAFERQMLRDLDALSAPAGEAGQVRALLAIGSQMDNATNELADDVEVGDLGALRRRAGQLSRLNTRFNNAAVALEANTCAEGSSLGDVFGS